jgi:glucokinase
MIKNIAIGVDVGGSHISCMAYDLRNKKLLDHTLSGSAVNNHATPKEIIETWARQISSTMELAGIEKVDGIGFAMPGPFDYEKGISLMDGKNDKYEKTYGMNVPLELRKTLDLGEDLKIRFVNDATAFAIGESQAGQSKGYNRSLAITLGTGFGSAFIKEGFPVVASEEVPQYGCVWHLPFEEGIADDYFSTRGLEKRYYTLSGEQITGVREIAIKAAADVKARELFEDFGWKLAFFLQPVLSRFRAEIIVIGGNISNALSLFQGGINKYFEKENMSILVCKSELMETASFIGSATLINNSFYEEALPSIRKM